MKKNLSLLLICILFLTACNTGTAIDNAVVATGEIYGVFNPLFAVSEGDKAVCSLLFDSLTEAGETGEIISGIADYEVLDDGLRYRFKIKNNAFFSNGEKIKASDILFTIRVLADKNYAGTVDLSNAGIRGFAAFKSGSADELAGFELSADEEAFSIHIDKADDNFLKNFTFGILSEKHYGAAYEKDGIEGIYALNGEPVGSGQYVLKSFDKKGVELFANAAYFKGEPQIKTLTLKCFEDENAEFDICETYMAGSMLKEPGDKKMAVKNTSEGDYYVLGFNCEDDFLGNADVRRAISFAADREKISRRICGSPSGVPTVFESTSQVDVKKAKEYMEKAGYSMGNEGVYQKDKKDAAFTVLMIKDDICIEIFDALREDMKALGIEVKAEYNPQAAAKVLKGQWQCYLLPLKENSSFLSADAFSEKSDKNVYSFENSKFDALAKNAHGNALTDEMIEIINNEVPVMALYEKVKTLIYNSSYSEIYFSPYRSVFRNIYSIKLNK